MSKSKQRTTADRIVVGILGVAALALILALSGSIPVGAQHMSLERRAGTAPSTGGGGPQVDPFFCVGDPCPGQTCDSVNGRCVGNVTLQPPMGAPMIALNADQLARFETGAEDFNRPLTLQQGLGPIMNKSSCGGCHSSPLGGSGAITVNRFGFIDPSTLEFDPLADLGGSLQQVQAIRQECAEFIPLPEANVVARRLTNSTLGFGLVEAIADSDIQANEFNPPSPEVSGRAMIVDVLESPGEMRVGRFGWKCQVATILTFSGDAALNEMGLTNRLVPTENAPNGDLALLELCDDVPDPEDGPDAAGRHFIDRTTDFQRYLAPPPQTPRSGMTGEAIFNDIGCADCHVSEFTTPALVSDDEADDALLAGRSLRPYSDFLVHDVGFAADFIEQGDAGIFELRTPPLWGMRKRDPMWHDARVAGGSLAFRIHGPNGVIVHHAQSGSEALSSAALFQALSAEDKDAVVAFLDSLGRREFDMDGDGLVDEFDVDLVETCAMLDEFFTPDHWCAIADADQDGDVDQDDLTLLDVVLGIDDGVDEGNDEDGEDVGFTGIGEVEDDGDHDGGTAGHTGVSSVSNQLFSGDLEREFAAAESRDWSGSIAPNAVDNSVQPRLDRDAPKRSGKSGRRHHRGL